jgi:F-type H+-transporting ATPase subunit delta
MGILANHVPIVEQLKPGVVEVLEGTTSSKFFVSGGFVSVLPDSKISITSVEAFSLDSFDASTVKTLLAEAQKNAASSDEKIAAEASIEVEVLEALATALH